jgi:pimeloyl-ACP methyl ester carboxylesterase
MLARRTALCGLPTLPLPLPPLRLLLLPPPLPPLLLLLLRPRRYNVRCALPSRGTAGVVAEGLQGDAGRAVSWPLSAEQIVELHRRSPISVIDKVDVPALMLLGAADQRVPRAQGRQWVAALQSVRQARDDDTQVVALEFPAEGHAIASVEGNAHAVQSAVSWLVEQLRADAS